MHELVSYWKFDSMYKKADLVRVTIDNVDARIEMDTYKFQSLAILTLNSNSIADDLILFPFKSCITTYSLYQLT